MLNATQTLAAAELLKSRPQVLDGTRVILNDQARRSWYQQVIDVMKRTSVTEKDCWKFCDLAGVPD